MAKLEISYVTYVISKQTRGWDKNSTEVISNVWKRPYISSCWREQNIIQYRETPTAFCTSRKVGNSKWGGNLPREDVENIRVSPLSHQLVEWDVNGYDRIECVQCPVGGRDQSWVGCIRLIEAHGHSQQESHLPWTSFRQLLNKSNRNCSPKIFGRDSDSCRVWRSYKPADTTSPITCFLRSSGWAQQFCNDRG